MGIGGSKDKFELEKLAKNLSIDLKGKFIKMNSIKWNKVDKHYPISIDKKQYDLLIELKFNEPTRCIKSFKNKTFIASGGVIHEFIRKEYDFIEEANYFIHTGEIRDLDILIFENTTLLVSVASDYNVVVTDLTHKYEIFSYNSVNSSGFGCTFVPTNYFQEFIVAVCHFGGNLQFYDWQGKIVKSIDCHHQSCRSLCFLTVSKADYIVVGSWDTKISITKLDSDPKKISVIRTLCDHKSLINKVLSFEDRNIIGVDSGNSLNAFDILSGKNIISLKDDRNAIWSACSLPDGYIAFGGSTGEPKMVKIFGDKKITTPFFDSECDGCIFSCNYNPESSLIFFASRKVKIFKYESISANVQKDREKRLNNFIGIQPSSKKMITFDEKNNKINSTSEDSSNISLILAELLPSDISPLLRTFLFENQTSENYSLIVKSLIFFFLGYFHLIFDEDLATIYKIVNNFILKSSKDEKFGKIDFFPFDKFKNYLCLSVQNIMDCETILKLFLESFNSYENKNIVTKTKMIKDEFCMCCLNHLKLFVLNEDKRRIKEFMDQNELSNFSSFSFFSKSSNIINGNETKTDLSLYSSNLIIKNASKRKFEKSESDGSDLIITGNDKSRNFFVNKAFLMLKSNFFFFLFSSGMKETKDEVVVIEQLNSKEVEIVVSYFYLTKENLNYFQQDSKFENDLIERSKKKKEDNGLSLGTMIRLHSFSIQFFEHYLITSIEKCISNLFNSSYFSKIILKKRIIKYGAYCYQNFDENKYENFYQNLFLDSFSENELKSLLAASFKEKEDTN